MSKLSEKYDLPITTVDDLYEDPEGLVWLASSQGLFAYTGKQFIPFDPVPYKKFIRLNFTETIVVGPRKILVLASGKKPDSTRFNFLKEEKLAGKHLVDAISEDDGKALWLLFENGLFVFENEEFSQRELSGFAGDYRDCRMVLIDNQFHLITPEGILYKRDTQSTEFTRYQINSSFNDLQQVVRYNDSIHFIIDNFQVLQLNRTHVSTPSWDGLPSAIEISSLVILNGAILIGSKAHGPWMGNHSETGFSFGKILNGNEPHRVIDLPFYEVQKIFCSENKNVWVLSGTDLWLLKPRAFKRISADIPMASFEQATFLNNGKIYLDSENGLFECYKSNTNEFTGGIAVVELKNRQSAIASHANRLWIASIDNTISYFENDRLVNVIDLTSRGGIIFNIYADHDGDLWVMQAPSTKPIKGTFKITSDLKTKSYDETEGFQNRMLAIKESPYGILYTAGIGENSYLYQYDAQGDRFINLSIEMKFDFGENFEVHDLAIGNDSTIWLASTAGLLRYKNKHIEKMEAPELYENEAVAVTVDIDGSVWFSTDYRGVVHYKNGSYTFFNQHAGLATNFLTYRFIVQTKDGTIWIGTREGFYFSSPDFRPTHKTLPPVLLSVNGIDFEVQRTTEFPFNTPMIFDFVSRTHPVESIQYGYQLAKQNNDEWINLFKADSLVLANLESGTYTLNIRALQSGGFEWSDPLVYRFTIQKIWYLQTMAMVTYFVLGIIAVALGVLIYNRNLRREKEILEHKVLVRTREIAEKNDEISAQMEELKQLNEEIASQRDNLVRQKLVIEEQNNLLGAAKVDLEQKVTERTNELSLSNRELVEHNIQLEQFTFMTAHNLRAPVARLMGLATIFNNANPSDPINKEVVTKIQESANALDEIIRDISTILQVKKSVGETFRSIRVQDVLIKVINSFLPEIENKKISISNRVNPSATIHGIETYVYSVFYNVISNSIKYADLRKEPEMKIESNETDGMVSLSFSDNGIGFDSVTQRERLFKPFSRLNAIKDGKGLGLYLMKIEMESMRGSISIQSTVDAGTSVTLVFRKA